MKCFLFDKLTDEMVKEIYSSLGEPAVLNRGSELYLNGHIGILEKGTATITRINDTADSVTVRTIYSGDIFGAASMFGVWREGKSKITADNCCTVYYISEQQLCCLMKEHFQIAVNYIYYLTERIRFLNHRIDAFSAGSAVQKVYEYLLSLSEDNTVTLNFGIAELARRLKIGRTSIYRSLHILEENGLLKRNNKTFIIK